MNTQLKFLTCGSVDDGKSTLIGKLLYDANILYIDQKESIEKEHLEYSYLLDGLIAEREQGITIDVAYRFFKTNKRSFIVADTPGHLQYTRNMAVGASFAELALLLINAKDGLKDQTYRHARISHMMGINYFVFAINKMDLINYDQTLFNNIQKQVIALVKELEIENYVIIPLVATDGDNVVYKSKNMPWYDGKTLLSYLEDVEILNLQNEEFIMSCQRISRTNNYRGYQGEVSSGKIKLNDEISILPLKEKAKLKRIMYGDKAIDEAISGMPISVELDRDLDVSRGDVLTNSNNLVVDDKFMAKILWMSNDDLSLTKSYYLKLDTQEAVVSINEVVYKEDIVTGEHLKVNSLFKNDLGEVRIMSLWPMVISTFDKHPSLARFLLIDRITNETVGAGIINRFDFKDNNLTYQKMDIGRNERAILLNQKPITIWMTGLSGSGKSALANAIENRLYNLGKHTIILDGDNIRLGLNRNLGFSEEDRSENIRRVAEVAKLLNDAGIIVITAFISPFKVDRNNARKIIGDESFFEIYLNTPLEVCEKRDVKGLYQKAREGKINNFTGIDSAYEEPAYPDLVIDSSTLSIEKAVDIVIHKLYEKGYLINE